MFVVDADGLLRCDQSECRGGLIVCGKFVSGRDCHVWFNSVVVHVLRLVEPFYQLLPFKIKELRRIAMVMA